MNKPWSAGWILVAMSGCGTATPPKPTEVIVTPEPVQPTPAPSAVAEAPPPPKACRVAGTALGSRVALVLSEAPDAKAWGMFMPGIEGDYEVQLQDGRAKRVAADFHARAVRIESDADATTVHLFRDEPTAFPPVVTVHPGASLSWGGTVGREVAIAFELERIFHSKVVTSATPCRTLTLTWTKRPAPPVPSSFTEDMSFDDGPEAVPLYASAKATEVALEVDTDHVALVKAGPVEGDRREVFIRRSEYDVRGWVPAARLSSSAPGGMGYGTGSGRLRPGRPLSVHACKTHVALHVFMAGRNWRVGTLDPKATLHVIGGEVEEGWAPIRIPDAPFYLTRGATLTARRSDFEHCPAPGG